MMLEVTEDDPGPAELLEVLWARLGPGEAAAPRRREALRILGSRRARREVPEQLDPELAAIFGLIVEPDDLTSLTPEIVAFLESDPTSGVAREAMPAVFQAYVRAVGRIVAAEARVLRDLVADVSPADRPQLLDETIEALLPLTTRGFDVLHRVLLLEALVETLAELDEPGDQGDPLAIAMVDLVGSTHHLKGAAPVDLEVLVDALFEAGQAATSHRAAHVLKYVGDGLFLSGRDVCEVADVALDVVDRLQEALPLRARGGLAWGPVTQRAGDVFGLPVNVAHIATKSARPGVLLATAEAAAFLPASRRGRYRTVQMAHPALGETRVATIRRAGDR